MVIALALDKEGFMVYITHLGAKISIYLAWEAQIVLFLIKKS